MQAFIGELHRLESLVADVRRMIGERAAQLQALEAGRFTVHEKRPGEPERDVTGENKERLRKEILELTQLVHELEGKPGRADRQQRRAEMTSAIDRNQAP